MTGLSNAPKLLKGALVSFPGGYLGPIPNVVIFQYNPEQVSRTLSERVPAATAHTGKARAAAAEDVNRVLGIPKEDITMEIQLDAADQLEKPAANPHVLLTGLHPVLAALEVMLYPRSEQMLKTDLLSGLGQVQVAPNELPLTLLVYGLSRVVPVKITSFSVTETFHDPMLNPIKAKVSLGMTVLTSTDLANNKLGKGVYTVYHIQKEVLSVVNFANTAGQIGGMLPL